MPMCGRMLEVTRVRRMQVRSSFMVKVILIVGRGLGGFN